MPPATPPPVPRLRSVTEAIADPGPLASLLPEEGACAWFRRDGAAIGLGEAARCEVESLTQADAWWQAVAAGMDDASASDDLPSGVGPRAFGSFVFDAGATARSSVMVVPAVLLVSRDGRHWMSRTAPVGRPLPDPVLPAPAPAPRGPGAVSWADGALSGPAWEEVVAEGVRRIAAGELEKVVLARSVVATTPERIDPRWLLGRLAPRYPRCWTFWVDDMIGATPEMLVRVDQGLVTSRVLAGTIWRGALGPKRNHRHGTEDTVSSSAIAEVLSQSDKNLAEHQYAVESVARALAPHCTSMNVPETPYVLELPNVMHLATDVNAVVRPGSTALALAAALHPSAAVCGTPTDAARATIAAIEGLDRGRYSGPVGWVDTHGNGEWAIALRCGRLMPDRHAMELYAGCGIVADSDPTTELAESNAKLVPMRDALEG